MSIKITPFGIINENDIDKLDEELSQYIYPIVANMLKMNTKNIVDILPPLNLLKLENVTKQRDKITTQSPPLPRLQPEQAGLAAPAAGGSKSMKRQTLR